MHSGACKGMDEETKILESLHNPFTIAREYALLGNYDTSLIYFDSAVKQLSTYIATVVDPTKRARFVKSCWRNERDGERERERWRDYQQM